MRVLERLVYIGPNRRAPVTVIEWLVALEDGEVARVAEGLPSAARAIADTLASQGIAFDPVPFEGQGERPVPDGESLAALGHVVTALAIVLQRSAGHRVAFRTVLPGGSPDRRRLVFEYEHDDVGIAAAEIAMRLVAEFLPGLGWTPDPDVPGDGASEALSAFRERAPKSVLPADTQAIIDHAARADIPCVKLEREPYAGVSGEFRIRPHGLLKLGHARHQRIVDGTLSLERSAHLVPWLFDRVERHAAMRSLGLRVPVTDPSGETHVVSRRIARAAKRIGYPVVIEARQRLAADPRNYTGEPPVVEEDGGLAPTIAAARARGPDIRVEKYVVGERFHLLFAGGTFLCAIGSDGPVEADRFHPSLLGSAAAAAARVEAGLLLLTVVTSDPARPLEDTGGAFVAIDPAPQLDRLLPAESSRLSSAADAFVGWLFPPGAPSRIPLVAVTGTNGKTTTSRLIDRMAREAGFQSGLACTHGVYLDGKLARAGDLAGIGGHHLLFESRDIDFGVLETARGGVANSGFMFDYCDVGVCLNVTPDHIGEFGIDSLDDMIAIKRSIVERAAGSVVLNADSEACLGMLPFDSRVSIALCSLERDARTLTDGDSERFACVVEAGPEGAEWLVWYGEDGREPVLPVADFPAALNGAARFNVSNALHAIAAARLLDIPVDAVARALRGFDTGFDTNPGRLNVFDDHPFRVIMDYAHNPDGLNALLDCVDRMRPSGKRILMYACTGNRTDAEVEAHTRFPVGRIDHFVVRRYPGPLRGRGEEEIPRRMHEILRQAGVPDESITLGIPPEEAANMAMALARPGDLVILAPGTGEFEALWDTVRTFSPE